MPFCYEMQLCIILPDPYSSLSNNEIDQKYLLIILGEFNTFGHCSYFPSKVPHN